MKKIRDKEKHLRRFIGLAVIFFSLELILQLLRIFHLWDPLFGGNPVTMFVSYCAGFIAAAMVFMGVAYLNMKK